MTPDIAYSFDNFDLSTFAHTLLGIFVVCLPTGLVLLIGLCIFARPVTYTLPSPHRQALMPLCAPFPRGLAHWGALLLALLIGAWTHLFWDAFTHEHGWFVDHWSRLQRPLGYWWGTTVHVYLALQEISTIVGIIIVAVAYCVWLRRKRMIKSDQRENDSWRYLFWCGTIIICLAIPFPAAVQYATQQKLHGLLFFRSICFQTAIHFEGLAFLVILVGSTLAYRWRKR